MMPFEIFKNRNYRNSNGKVNIDDSGVHGIELGDYLVKSRGGVQFNAEYIIPAKSPYDRPEFIIARNEAERDYILRQRARMY